MKRFIFVLTQLCSLIFILSASAQGTMFTYQGRLVENGEPFTGNAEFIATLWNTSTGGTALETNGPTIVGVTNGLFTLPLDFGTRFPGAQRWVGLEVRTAIGAYTPLAPRQQITPSPYAITAEGVSGNVPASQLTGTIDNARLAAEVSLLGTSIDSSEIANGSIVNADIHANAAIADSKLATISTPGKVADTALPSSVSRLGQTIESEEIADGTITLTDLNTTNFQTGFWLVGGNAGTVSGQFLGTTDDEPLEFRVNGIRALRLVDHGDSSADSGTTSDLAPNVIGGTALNYVPAGVVGATIGGGGAGDYGGVAYSNRVAGNFGTVSGGRANQLQQGAEASTVAGGANNVIGQNVSYSVISGGLGNSVAAGALYSVVAGGNGNMIRPRSEYASIGGGGANQISFDSAHATISGGTLNATGSNSQHSVIGGGYANLVDTNCMGSIVAGGYNNHITNGSTYASIGGGSDNAIGGLSYYSTVGGGALNVIGFDAARATISGGENNRIEASGAGSVIGGGTMNNIAPGAALSVIAGGSLQNIGSNTLSAFIGGGYNQSIARDASYSTIGGGTGNKINSATFCTIAGGQLNEIGSDAANTTIGGGQNNLVDTNADYSLISGGNGNKIYSHSANATVGGGFLNRIGASAGYSTLAGGANNLIGTNATYSTIGGGSQNTNAFGAQYATIPGGRQNAATNYAFAAGYRAKANHQGAFVWGDSFSADVASTNNNSVTMRATGGYRLITSSGGNGAFLAAGSGSWTSMSDRNAKENFTPVTPSEVLEKVATLPLSTWSYKAQEGTVRHMGPMAQDFKAAFGLGDSDTGITTVDADGVALAAIQGLNEKLEQTVQDKEAKITALENRMAEMERLLNAVLASNVGAESAR